MPILMTNSRVEFAARLFGFQAAAAQITGDFFLLQDQYFQVSYVEK